MVGALGISFVALSCNWLWFINLLLIFGHSCEKPRYGKNSCLIQDFPTGPRHVKLARRHLMTIPRPKPPYRHVGMLLAGNDKPQGTDGAQEQPKGIVAHNGVELGALRLR